MDRKSGLNDEQERSTFYTDLIERSPFGIFVVDADLKLVKLSAGARPVFSVVDQPLGQDFAQLMAKIWPEPFLSEALGHFRHTLATGESYHAPSTVEYRVGSGILEAYDWKIDRVMGEDGRYGVACYFIDLSERQRAEEVLRLSEERYRNLMESIDQGYCVVRLEWNEQGEPVDYHFEQVNAAFITLSGLPADVVGKGVRKLVPDLAPYWIEVVGRVARTGVAERFEHKSSRSSKWFDLYAVRLCAKNERRVALLFSDITARKMRELRTGLLDAIGQELANLSTTGAIMQSIGALMGRFLGISGCVFASVDQQEEEVAVQVGWHAHAAPPVQERYRLADYVTPAFAAANRAGEPFVVDDTVADPRTHADAYARMEVAAFVTIPVSRSGQWTAIFAVNSATPRRWTSEEVALLREICERLFSRLEAIRAQEQLADEKTQAVKIVETLHEPLLVLNPDLTVRSANPAFYTFFQVNKEETIGRPVYALGNGQWNIPALHTLLENVLPDSNEFYDHEVTHRFEHLGERVMLLNGRRLDHVQLILLGIRDITERKHAEEALRASEERYRELFERITEAFCLVEVIFEEERAVDLQVLLVNPGFEQHTGLTDAEGQRIRQLIPGLEEHWLTLFGRVALTGQDERMEALARPLGDRWFAVNAYRVGAPEQRHVAVIFSDITQRERSAATLRESEERLSLALDIGELASWDWDLRTGDVKWNDRHFLMQGYAVGEVTPSYEVWRARVHPEDREPMDEMIQNALNTKKTFIGDFRTMHPDGSQYWCSARGRFFYDEEGKPYRMIGVMEDVTDRKQADANRDALLRLTDLLRTPDSDEEMQRRAMQLLGETLGAASVSFWEVDGDHYVVEITYSGDQPSLRGRYPIASFGEWSLERYRAGHTVVEHDIPNEGRLPQEKEAFAAMGVAAYIGVPVHRNGELAGGLGISSSVPRRWRADEVALAEQFAIRTRDAVQRINAERALQLADKRKDEFLATLAHELRNPLAPIRNGVELLRMDDVISADNAELLGMVDRQLTHLVRLVDDLMDVSRISRGKLQLQQQPTPVQAVLEEAVEASRALIADSGHTLEIDSQGSLPVLHVDRARMVQVLTNLLTNAAKYTRRGGRIRLGAYTEAKWMVFVVEDNGVGIPEDALPTLFDLFSQVDGTLGQAQGGLGIGLNLVKQLVGLHQGQVDVRSTVGAGTTFTVRLPLQEVKALKNTVAPQPAAQARRRVVIIDDNEDGAFTLAALLNKAGCHARYAHSGAEGLELVQEHRPHVVVLDIGMPEMDGYTVARRIRAMDPQPRPILIALTGYGQEDDKRRALDAGFDHHYTKPVKPDEIKALVTTPG